jgi:peptidyl-prolyl cis-trans isomerase A (cyclophilin A)
LLPFNSRVLPLALAVTGLISTLPAQTVRFDTTFGGIDVVLTPDVTPATVANFMAYVNSGAYNKTIFHRSLNATNSTSNVFYLLQGGGYVLGPGSLPNLIPQNPPVTNEFKASNVRGTIAMAQYGGDINSATDQWYFNTSDNSGSLDPQNFVVFGKVANSAGLAVVDLINNLPTYSYNAGQEANFANLPLQNYNSGLIRAANYIFVNSIAPIQPTATSAGIAGAANYTPNATAGISPGEILLIFGSQLGPTQLSGLTVNSSNSVDTLLQGTQVTFNGTPGPMIYTRSDVLAVVAPYGIANSSSVDVVVSYLGIPTAKMTLKVVPANPGIFTADTSGKGDAAIIRYDDTTAINASNPAVPGNTLELYGDGYGVTSPSLADGAVVGTTLPQPTAATSLLIDGQPVPTSYFGAAPGDVNGVLQVNFVVPNLKPGSHQIQIKVGNATSPAGVTLQTK